MAQTSFLLSRSPAEDELSATAQETHCGEREEAETEKGAQWGEVGSREKTKHGGAEDSEQNQALGLETSLPSERKQRQNMPFILLEEKMVLFMGFCVYS